MCYFFSDACCSCSPGRARVNTALKPYKFYVLTDHTDLPITVYFFTKSFYGRETRGNTRHTPHGSNTQTPKRRNGTRARPAPAPARKAGERVKPKNVTGHAYLLLHPLK